MCVCGLFLCSPKYIVLSHTLTALFFQVCVTSLSQEMSVLVIVLRCVCACVYSHQF